jgi:hypothetical protein
LHTTTSIHAMYDTSCMLTRKHTQCTCTVAGYCGRVCGCQGEQLRYIIEKYANLFTGSQDYKRYKCSIYTEMCSNIPCVREQSACCTWYVRRARLTGAFSLQGHTCFWVRRQILAKAVGCMRALAVIHTGAFRSKAQLS